MASVRKYNTALYLLNIIICLVILFDTYFAGTYTEDEICSKKEIVSRRSRTSRRDDWLITSTSGITYQIPERVYHSIHEADTFIVHRTGLLHKANGISFYKEDGNQYYIKTGPIFGWLFGLALTLFPLLTCLVLLFYTIKCKKEIELRHAVLLTVISCTIVYAYWVSQS
ncbi:MAG: hypothetical protein ABI666_02145 [Ferruginibacter sp.]